MLSLQRLKREIVRFATQQSINSIQTAGSIAQNGLQVLGSIQVGYTRKYSALYLQGKYYTDWARPGSSRTCSRRDPGSRRAHGNKGIDSPLCTTCAVYFQNLGLTGLGSSLGLAGTGVQGALSGLVSLDTY